MGTARGAAIRHRRCRLEIVDAQQVAERNLQLIDQLHDAADDLAAEVLVALRQQHIGRDGLERSCMLG